MKIFFAIFCLFAVLLFSEEAAESCASLPITPWEAEFEDGTIFFMTPLDYFDPSSDDERLRIRTGLYTTNPLENIYFADINAREQSVFFFGNGKYFATVQIPYRNFDREILGGGLVNFFTDGVLSTSYCTAELHFKGRSGWRKEPWHRYEAITATQNENELTVETVNKNVFVFDITNGEIISAQIVDTLPDSQVHPQAALTGLILSIFVVIILFLMIRKKIFAG
jgi:hypothetical protein